MRHLAPLLLAGVLALTACAAPSAAAPSASPTATPTSTPSLSTPSPTATPPPAEATPPAACTSYTPSAPLPTAEGGERIANAAAAADLPETISLNLGVQVITSTDEPGMFEAVARVCSNPLTHDQLAEVGNAIAIAIYAAPEHKSLTRLIVAPWVPDGDSVQPDPQLDAISTDYELYLWDHAGPLDGNWD